jgi:hypothetical protein
MTTAAVEKKSIRSTIPARVLAVVVIVVGHAVSANKVPFVRGRPALFIGYLVGAGIMMLGGIVEILFGINAEGKSLEAITKPTSESPHEAPAVPAP